MCVTNRATTFTFVAAEQVTDGLSVSGRALGPRSPVLHGRQRHRDLRTRPEETRNLASRRKGEHAWVLAHPGPASYGKDPGPPVGGRAHPRSGHRRTVGRPRDG